MNIGRLFKILDSKIVIGISNIIFLNKQRIKKEDAIKEVLTEIEEYFKEHNIKRYLIGEEVKLLQKLYFKNQISKTKGRVKEKYINLLAELEKLESSEETIRFLAKYYLEDMAADLNPAYVILLKIVFSYMYKEFIKNFKIYSESNNTIERLKRIQGNYPLFYIPNHVSNADHIPIAFGLNKKKLYHPVIVAGENLYRGISKRLLPKINVEKLRRDYMKENFKWLQNPLYSMVFKKYNRYLWRQNEPFLFYIEGGRSRDGKIKSPKLGIISEIFQFIKEEKKKVYFVPVSISYTIVPEDLELYEATKGKNITEKDLFKHLSELNFEYKKFKKPYIYVKIMDPIEITYKEKISHKDFAFSIVEKIKKNIVITPTYFLAKLILNNENNNLELNFVENEYNRLATTEELKGKFNLAIDIFTKKKFIEIDNKNRILIKIRELIVQYANRIS